MILPRCVNLQNHSALSSLQSQRESLNNIIVRLRTSTRKHYYVRHRHCLLAFLSGSKCSQILRIGLLSCRRFQKRAPLSSNAALYSSVNRNADLVSLNSSALSLQGLQNQLFSIFLLMTVSRRIANYDQRPC